MDKTSPTGDEQIVAQNGGAMSQIHQVDKEGPTGGEQVVEPNGGTRSQIHHMGKMRPEGDLVIARNCSATSSIMHVGEISPMTTVPTQPPSREQHPRKLNFPRQLVPRQ